MSSNGLYTREDANNARMGLAEIFGIDLEKMEMNQISFSEADGGGVNINLKALHIKGFEPDKQWRVGKVLQNALNGSGVECSFSPKSRILESIIIRGDMGGLIKTIGDMDSQATQDLKATLQQLRYGRGATALSV